MPATPAPAGIEAPRDAAGGLAPIVSLKIVVAGGFGVGKTTLVGSVSEIEPLSTEATMTAVSEGMDDLTDVPDKASTTVAMDFGRITLASDLVLYLFGTPGQARFWFMWDDLTRGAVGAMVLVDTRRLEDSFPAVDYFESSRLPFVVAINRFDDAPVYSEEDIRDALSLSPGVPLLVCDARQRRDVAAVLQAVVSHALALMP